MIKKILEILNTNEWYYLKKKKKDTLLFCLYFSWARWFRPGRVVTMKPSLNSHDFGLVDLRLVRSKF